MSIGGFFGGSAQQLAMLQQQAAFNAFNQQALTRLQQQATQQGGLFNGLGQPYSTLNSYSIALPSAANLRAMLAASANVPRVRPSRIPSAGIRAGEIVAYRVWDILPDLMLSSITADHEWPVGVPMQAVDDHVANGLGIHCFKGIDSARGVADGLYGLMKVVGSIEIWGEIVEHDLGYRAQYAAIRSLDYIVNDRWVFLRGMRKRRLLNRIREKYGLT